MEGTGKKPAVLGGALGRARVAGACVLRAVVRGHDDVGEHRERAAAVLHKPVPDWHGGDGGVVVYWRADRPDHEGDQGQRASARVYRAERLRMWGRLRGCVGGLFLILQTHVDNFILISLKYSIRIKVQKYLPTQSKTE